VIALASVSAHRLEVQALKTLIVMVLLVIAFRVLGKREAAQLNLYDLAMLMALANAVQNAMTGGLGNLPVGLATSSTLIVSAFVLTRVVVRRPALERALVGSPVLLVRDGRVLTGRLRRNLVAPGELAEACREHGLDGTGQCGLAVLEVDGSISIVPRAVTKDDGRPATRPPGGPAASTAAPTPTATAPRRSAASWRARRAGRARRRGRG
jgi:uncharacterized membrane protein YcaP (DUF421 family)